MAKILLVPTTPAPNFGVKDEPNVGGPRLVENTGNAVQLEEIYARFTISILKTLLPSDPFQGSGMDRYLHSDFVTFSLGQSLQGDERFKLKFTGAEDH